MAESTFQFRAHPVPTIIMVILTPLFCGLALWQLDRAEQKRSVAASLETRRKLPVLPVSGALPATDQLEYRKVMAEGRRVDLVSRLRETEPVCLGAGSTDMRGLRRPAAWPRRIWRTLLRRIRMVVPLMESLARRADALTLSLRTRRPEAPVSSGRPSVGEFLVLIIWLTGLVWLIASRYTGVSP